MPDHQAVIDAIRRRPGMYVGGTGGDGLTTLVQEVLGNAYDQYLQGRCTRITLRVSADTIIEVSDDGPGIAAGDLHRFLTVFRDTPTADGHRPHVHLQKLGLGLVPVNALCAWLEVSTVRDGQQAVARHERGHGARPVVTSTTLPTGTTVRFQPDPLLFGSASLSRPKLVERLDDLVFLSPGLKLELHLESDAAAQYGLAARVAWAAGCPVAEVAHTRRRVTSAGHPLDVEVALVWCEDRWDYDGSSLQGIDSFVNFARTPEHGTHVSGMLHGICRHAGITDHARAARELVAAVAVVLEDVHYGAPVKRRLVNQHVHGAVARVTQELLATWSVAWPARAAQVPRDDPDA